MPQVQHCVNLIYFLFFSALIFFLLLLLSGDHQKAWKIALNNNSSVRANYNYSTQSHPFFHLIDTIPL